MNFTWNFLTRIPREFFFVQDHVKWYENYFRRIPRHLKVSVFFLKIWISCETQFPVFLIEYNCWTVEWCYKWCYYSYILVPDNSHKGCPLVGRSTIKGNDRGRPERSPECGLFLGRLVGRGWGRLWPIVVKEGLQIGCGFLWSHDRWCLSAYNISTNRLTLVLWYS